MARLSRDQAGAGAVAWLLLCGLAWANDAPADPQQRRAALNESLERSRHIGNEVRKTLADFRRWRPREIGRAPHHDGAFFSNVLRREPRRLNRIGIDIKSGPR